MADNYSELVSGIKKEIEKIQNAREELDSVDQDEGEVEDLQAPLKRINFSSWRIIQLIHSFETRMMEGLKESSDLAGVAPDLEKEPKTP